MGITVVYREESRVVAEVTGLTCNPCGRELQAHNGGFQAIHMMGGWGDHFPADQEQFEFLACDDCLRKWVESFVDPNVSKGGGFGQDLPYTVWHSETGTEMLVERGWLYPAGETLPEKFWETPPMNDEDDYPEMGIWEHFKGKRYQVLDFAWDTVTKLPHVIYRALYEESKVWARPLAEWYESVERGTYTGPRFKLRGRLGPEVVQVVRRDGGPEDLVDE